jgi:hypothetical protein
MMWTVLVAGVAHARLFTPPVANVASSSPTWVSMDNAVAPMVQPQVIVDVPVQQQTGSGLSSVSTLGVALAAAGLGVVAGRQAMLFTSGGKKSQPKKTGPINAQDRPRNRGGPYETNKNNIQTQRNGFGNFVQKFQLASGKSKYGVPIFLPNGNVNPAYLAAERKDMQQKSKLNTAKAESKRKGLISTGRFELADYIKKAIGPVGSGKDYYQSGR